MNAIRQRKEFTPELLDSAVKAIDNLPSSPPARALSAREMVISMSDKIRARIGAGYTHQQIVETLAAAGFNISAGTLKTYLSIASKSSKGRQPRKKADTSVNTLVNEAANHSVTFAAKPAAQAAPPRRVFQDPDEK